MCLLKHLSKKKKSELQCEQDDAMHLELILNIGLQRFLV